MNTSKQAFTMVTVYLKWSMVTAMADALKKCISCLSSYLFDRLVLSDGKTLGTREICFLGPAQKARSK